MSEILFILGAGASAHTGAPLMKDFMRKIRDISGKEINPDLQKDYSLVMRGFKELDKKRSRIIMEYEENIELLFGSFEMAKLLGSLGDLSKTELFLLPEAMRRVICDTIDRNIEVMLKENSIVSFSVYSSFIFLIKRIIAELNVWPAIISFNYDICLDLLLQQHTIEINYGINNNQKSGLPYYKLHGSINWFNPKGREHDIGVIEPRIILNRFIADYKSPCPLGIIKNYFINRELQTKIPFIVPPTWNKTNYHNKIDMVWKKAAKEFADARIIIIIGYSFPDTDMFFRHLLALGFTNTIIDKILIIDMSTDPVTRIKKISAESVKRNVVSQRYGSGEFNDNTIKEMESIIFGYK